MRITRYVRYVKYYWHMVVLLSILALTGFLSFYDVGREGYANEYYSAAVKSMLSSWHNFFFASFDPGGFVSVDKPALGLWLQTLSARIFGFYGWSLILPQALAAVVSVAVLYHLVGRTFGKTAGIASALVLALTPVFIAVSRTNNFDASLIMIMLLATWALVAAAERGSFKLLLLSMVLAGLGFNVKMLQAFMVLPAFYLVYFFTAALKNGKKLLHLAGATVLLLVVSLSWAAAVDLTPADKRPYVGSSGSNSVLALALGYNGIQRVVGTGNPVTGGDARNDGGVPKLQPPLNGAGDFQDDSMPGRFNMQAGNTGRPQGDVGPGQITSPVGSGGPGGIGENGRQGVFRIFNRQLAGQISWLIPLALSGIIAALLRAREREKKRRRKVVRSILLWGAWLAPMFVYFSISGFFHRYYLSMLAPGIAALSGIGIVELWRVYMGRGLKCLILPAALVGNAALQVFLLSRYTEWSKTLAPAVSGICVASAAALVVIRILKKDNYGKTIKFIVAAGFAALLIAPAIWACTPIMYGSDTHLPHAGPELSSANSGEAGNQGIDRMSHSMSDTGTSGLIDFLLSNKKGEKYLVAVTNAAAAEPIILETGEPVMAVGGYSGTDNILTANKLEKMVKNGEVRYFLVSGMGAPQSGVYKWVRENGSIVSSDKLTGGILLYDLKPVYPQQK